MARDEWWKRLKPLHNDDIASIMREIKRQNILTDGSYIKLWEYIHALEENHIIQVEKKWPQNRESQISEDDLF